MTFFNSEDQEEFSTPNEATMQKFDLFFYNGKHHYYESDDWEDIFYKISYDCEVDQIKKIDFIIDEANKQHPNNLFFLLKKAAKEAFSKNFVLSNQLFAQAKIINPNDSDIFVVESEIFSHFGKYEKALAALKIAYNNGGEPESIFFQMASCYQCLNKTRAAMLLYKNIALLNPYNDFAIDHLAEILFEEEWFDEAVKIFKKLTDLNPYSEDIWYNLGNAHLGLEEYKEAIWAQEMVLAINDESTFGKIGLANAYQEKGEIEFAVTLYEDLLANNFADAEIYFSLGYCYEKLKKYEQSRIYYRNSLAENSDNAQAWYGIGATLMAESSYNMALHFLKKAHFISGNEESIFGLSLAATYLALNKSEKAVEIYEQLKLFYFDEYEVWLDYSTCLSTQSKNEKALEILESALSYLPNNHQIKYRIAAILIKLERTTEGIVYLEDALQKNFMDHNLMFIFEPKCKKDKNIKKIINQYKKIV